MRFLITEETIAYVPTPRQGKGEPCRKLML